jgi:membrane protease YdiL (CAAX protease family)
VWRRWSPRTAVYGGLAGFAFAIVLFGIFAGVYIPAGGNEEDPTFITVGAVLQNVAFIAAAWWFGSRPGRLALSDFGLRAASFKRALAVAFGLGIVYVLLLTVYTQLVTLKEDTVPQDLGADRSTTAMIVFALIAVLMAPLLEEFFFRGFIFRALANGWGVALGAIASAAFFGILHWDFETTDRLLAVAPLTLFGLLLALAYHYSGTLYTSIAMHATNNAIAVVAFAAGEESDVGIIVAAALWIMVMAFCLFGSRLTDKTGGDGEAMPIAQRPAPPPDPFAPPGSFPPPTGPHPAAQPPAMPSPPTPHPYGPPLVPLPPPPPAYPPAYPPPAPAPPPANPPGYTQPPPGPAGPPSPPPPA